MQPTIFFLGGGSEIGHRERPGVWTDRLEQFIPGPQSPQRRRRHFGKAAPGLPAPARKPLLIQVVHAPGQRHRLVLLRHLDVRDILRHGQRCAARQHLRCSWFCSALFRTHPQRIRPHQTVDLVRVESHADQRETRLFLVWRLQVRAHRKLTRMGVRQRRQKDWNATVPQASQSADQRRQGFIFSGLRKRDVQKDGARRVGTSQIFEPSGMGGVGDGPALVQLA